MTLRPLRHDDELLEKAKRFCRDNWSAGYVEFSYTASRSLNAKGLPMTWLLITDGENPEIVGFYQLTDDVSLEYAKKLSPFLSSIFIAKPLRGKNLGKTLIAHARKCAQELGYDSLYLCTNLVGYFEKHGFYRYTVDNARGKPIKILSVSSGD